MSSSNSLLKRTLSAWADGFEGANTVARLLAQQTGVPLPETFPSWNNRLSLFKAAVVHQRKQLMKHTMQPELRHLFLALDTLQTEDERLADVMSFSYLLRLDTDTLATLFVVPPKHMILTLQQGKNWIKNFDPSAIYNAHDAPKGPLP